MLSYDGRNRQTVNLLKTIYFDHPEWTPVSVSIMPATWMRHREALEEVCAAHPKIFPGFRKGRRDFDKVDDPLYNPGRITDTWGLVWENVEKGLSSYVVTHPLEDWDALETFQPPDPEKDAYIGPRDWKAEKARLKRRKAGGGLAQAEPLPHGFMYMWLFYLRGFENFMMDIATDDPRIHKVIEMVRDYNAEVVKKFIDLGAEYLTFGDDLGLQKALPMSPQMWRKYIKPPYEAVLGQCRDRGIPVYLHTDGHILEIIPDLHEVGVTVVNPQIGANGAEGLKEAAECGIAMNVDLDRQFFPFGTPSELEQHVREVFEILHNPEGGLMLHAEFEPDVPIENIDAVLSALEDVCNIPDSPN